MNILIDLLPTEVDGLRVNFDFRTMVLFELLMQDKEVSEREKLISAIELFYIDLPKDKKTAVDNLLWFWRCGKDVEEENGIGKGGKAQKAYCFDQDDDYIYAAFLEQYGVDLQDVESLHWWKFRAMFKSLKADTEIVKVMGYRLTDTKGMSKSEKAFYTKMKKIHQLKATFDTNKLSYEAYKQSMLDYVNKRLSQKNTSAK